MFTIKLMETREFPGIMANEPSSYRQSTRLIEAADVKIHNLRPDNVLWEIAGRMPDGTHFAEYVWPQEARDAEPKPCPKVPSGFAEDMTFYYAAFIENSQGKTTEMIR